MAPIPRNGCRITASCVIIPWTKAKETGSRSARFEVETSVQTERVESYVRQSSSTTEFTGLQRCGGLSLESHTYVHRRLCLGIEFSERPKTLNVRIVRRLRTYTQPHVSELSKYSNKQASLPCASKTRPGPTRHHPRCLKRAPNAPSLSQHSPQSHRPHLPLSLTSSHRSYLLPNSSPSPTPAQLSPLDSP
jgi:hypothetical protein